MKSVVNGSMNGQPFQGVWIGGYDKFNKKYVSLWVDSMRMEPVGAESCVADGTWDAKTRTFAWKGKSSMGEHRSSLVFKDNDNSIETCWMTPPGGKEIQCMEITRKRATRPAPAIAANAAMKAPSKEMEPLFQSIGNWTTTVKMAASGDRPASESPGTDKATPICNGNWIWCDFNSNFGGMPFEGHGIDGYDGGEKKYVSYWIDSMSCVLMKTSGNHDAAKNACTLDGTSLDDQGKPMTIHQVLTMPDANTRILNMTFKSPNSTEQMEITYKKAGKG